MKLETDRLQIVPVDQDFVDQLSPDDYLIHGFIKKYLKELKEDASLIGWGVWFVIEKDTKVIVGDIGFKGKPVDQTVEVGYGIIPSAQGKGYATEAVGRIIDWAYETKQVHKVIADCLDDNMASIKVLEKLGMKRIDQVDNMLKWEHSK